MGQLYLQRFVYRGASDKATFDKALGYRQRDHGQDWQLGWRKEGPHARPWVRYGEWRLRAARRG